jgi:tetratricopeptide (TPR) repeat protein
MGIVKMELGDYAQARRLLEEALHFFEESGPESERLVVLWELAYLAIRMGQFKEAEENLERVRRLARANGTADWRALAVSTALMGLLFYYRHEDGQALAYFEEADGYFQKYRQPVDEARYLLLPKATILLDQGEREAAEILLNRVRPLQTRSGDNPIVLRLRLLEARIAHTGGRSQAAREILASLEAHPERPSDPALIQYELFQVTRSREHAELALTLFEKLAADTPDVRYQERSRELALFLNTAD